MDPSLSITEYNIRAPLMRDVRIEALPPELQDFVAGLITTIVDAAVLGDPGSIERLRSVKGTHGTKSEDPHYADRWGVVQHIQTFRGWLNQPQSFDRDLFWHPPQVPHVPVAPRTEALRKLLTAITPAFEGLDPAWIERELSDTRSDYDVAAALSEKCNAFGDGAPTRERRTVLDAIDRAKKLYKRAHASETSRKKKHAR